jgi:hypothetical protein
VSKSQKLLMAVALLASGYGLALVWNATANFISPFSPASSETGDRAASLAPGTTIDGVHLLPRSAADQTAGLQPVPNGNQAAASTPALPDAHPTWLPVGPQARIVSVETNLSQPAGQTNLGNNVVKATPSLFVADTGGDRGNPVAMPLPSAQVTAVTPIDESASTSASPWDRWPQWQPATAATTAPLSPATTSAANEATNRVVAALDQKPATSASTATAIQTSFNAMAPSMSVENSPTRLVPVSPPLADADDEDAGPRTHSIVDGDTLAKLAERFLGDPLQSDRIYQLNRDVLSSPELLPIGIDLKLPPRQSLNSNRGVAALAPASMASPAPFASPSASALVPVENVGKAVVDMPRAQLLRPLPPVEPAMPPTIPAAYAATGH